MLVEFESFASLHVSKYYELLFTVQELLTWWENEKEFLEEQEWVAFIFLQEYINVLRKLE